MKPIFKRLEIVDKEVKKEPEMAVMKLLQS